MTYQDRTTMDEIYAIKSLSDAAQVLESRFHVPRAEAQSVVKKMQRAIINENLQAITSLLSRPDAFY